jgi:hypothetical protein
MARRARLDVLERCPCVLGGELVCRVLLSPTSVRAAALHYCSTDTVRRRSVRPGVPVVWLVCPVLFVAVMLSVRYSDVCISVDSTGSPRPPLPTLVSALPSPSPAPIRSQILRRRLGLCSGFAFRFPFRVRPADVVSSDKLVPDDVEVGEAGWNGPGLSTRSVGTGDAGGVLSGMSHSTGLESLTVGLSAITSSMTDRHRTISVAFSVVNFIFGKCLTGVWRCAPESQVRAKKTPREAQRPRLQNAGTNVPPIGEGLP